MRFLYACLLRLHPRPFRDRFAEEMMAIFDEASGAMGSFRLLGDVLLSLIRQWAFRPQQQPVAARVAGPSPMFYTLETYKPGRLALIQGGALSAIFFWVVSFAATQGGHPLKFPGAPHPHSGLLSVSELAGPDAAVRVRPPATDPWREFAERYFKIIYVLDALDADHDYVISASEIAAAPTALRKLDLNGDGRLTAEECGLHPAGVEGLRKPFMAANPVLAALDTDHDGEISAREIRNAPAGLKRLDLNGDGQLMPVEIAPDSEARKILLSRQ